MLLDPFADLPARELFQRTRDDDDHVFQLIALHLTLLCCRHNIELLQLAKNLCIAFVLEIRSNGRCACLAHIAHRKNRFLGCHCQGLQCLESLHEGECCRFADSRNAEARQEAVRFFLL